MIFFILFGSLWILTTNVCLLVLKGLKYLGEVKLSNLRMVTKSRQGTSNILNNKSEPQNLLLNNLMTLHNYDSPLIWWSIQAFNNHLKWHIIIFKALSPPLYLILMRIAILENKKLRPTELSQLWSFNWNPDPQISYRILSVLPTLI